MTRVQDPSGQQQTTAGGHGLGSQTQPRWKVQGKMHPTWVVAVQDPSAQQQAPAGCGHGFGVQECQSPCQTLGAGH